MPWFDNDEDAVVEEEPPLNINGYNVKFWEPTSKEYHEVAEISKKEMKIMRDKWGKVGMSQWVEEDKNGYEKYDKLYHTSVSMLNKAFEFINNDCIQKEGTGYKCLPVEGYNKTTYYLKVGEATNDWECNCQGFQTKLRNKEKPICSHVLALKQFLFINNYNREELLKWRRK